MYIANYIMYIANYILVNIINIKDWPLYNRQLIILMAMFTNFGTYDHQGYKLIEPEY